MKSSYVLDQIVNLIPRDGKSNNMNTWEEGSVEKTILDTLSKVGDENLGKEDGRVTAFLSGVWSGIYMMVANDVQWTAIRMLLKATTRTLKSAYDC